MKIWSPLKVFRSLIRFLVSKKAFRTEFETNIFDFFCIWIRISKFNSSKRTNIKSFLSYNFETFKFLARHSMFVLICVQTNRVLLMLFVVSSIIRYLVFIGLGRLPTIRYALVFEENQIPLENRIRERQLYLTSLNRNNWRQIFFKFKNRKFHLLTSNHPRSQREHHRRLYLDVIWWCWPRDPLVKKIT